MVVSSAADLFKLGSSSVSSIYLGSSELWKLNNPGYVLLTPSSITTNGSTGSIGPNGEVTMTDGTYVSVNGVFSSEFENYVSFASFKKTSGTGSGTIFRYCSEGSSDVSTNYQFQNIIANGSSVSGSRTSGTTYGSCAWSSSTNQFGIAIRMYCPYLNKISSWRSTPSYADFYSLFDVSGILNTTSSYDGFQFVNADGNSFDNISITVYGVRS